jgi:hypothetical protein
MPSYNAFNPAQLLSLGINRVEVRTAFSPPVVIDPNSPPNPATQALLKKVMPAVILSGPAGRVEIAPYGVPSGVSSAVKRYGWSLGIGLGATLLGVMFLGGAMFGRKK